VVDTTEDCEQTRVTAHTAINDREIACADVDSTLIATHLAINDRRIARVEDGAARQIAARKTAASSQREPSQCQVACGRHMQKPSLEITEAAIYCGRRCA